MYGYGYGYYSMFDPTMILVLIGVFLSLGASAKVKSTYARFSRVRSMTGMTGAEAARQLLNSQGIYDVQIRQVAGSLTDHYDPRTKTVNLSESVMVPVVNIGAQLSWPMILIGVLVGGMGSPIVSLGILLFSLSVLFQLVTLPVEFNASARAVRLLDSTGILRGEEVGYTKQVLGAAALTYVAAAAGSILQLLRLIILFGGRRDD